MTTEATNTTPDDQQDPTREELIDQRDRMGKALRDAWRVLDGIAAIRDDDDLDRIPAAEDALDALVEITVEVGDYDAEVGAHTWWDRRGVEIWSE